MSQVEKKVLAIDIVDIDGIVIRPLHWPRTDDVEGITAVLKLGLASNYRGAADFKRMLPAKIGFEFILGNAAATAMIATLRLHLRLA